jgi:predicted amidohydrolase
MSTLAACQVEIDIDDPDATWQKRVTNAVNDAAASGADIVVLPELAWTGYVFGSIAEAADRAEGANGRNARRLRQLSAELGIVLIFGFVERNPDGPQPYNSAVLIDRGEVLAVYRKTHLWDREKLIFEVGSNQLR